MSAHLEINFHGIEKSDALEAKIREKFNKLQRYFDRMSACRVVLEAPHRNSAKAKAFLVKIEISVPGQKPIIVHHEREGSSPQDELGLLLRDGFEAATRRVDELSNKLAGRARTERTRRRPAPNGPSES
jgi:ribosome-associated translation inhibitor RaiA